MKSKDHNVLLWGVDDKGKGSDKWTISNEKYYNLLAERLNTGIKI